MSNLILRSIKNRGEKIFARIRDQIRNDRLRSLYIFTGIVVVVIASYFIWLNFFHLNEVVVEEKQENYSQISQALNTGENFLARIGTGINRAFADMFGLPNENIIAEFPVGSRETRDRRQIKNELFVFTDRDSVYVGGKIIKNGSGFTPNGEVTILFSSPSGETKSVTISADQKGQFNYPYTVSSSTETGVYHYWAENKATGFITDRIRYLVVSASQKNIAPEAVAEILADAARKEEDKKVNSLALPQECSFSGAGTATNTKRVVINEVAWMGSDCPNRRECSNNEWIELKNISPIEVDVSGWWLIDQREQIKVVFPQNTIISASRFFLLERTDDNSVPNVRADIVYQGILSNDEEGLRLLNSNCLIQDEVLTDPKWPAGETGSRKTMERKTDLSGWQTSVFVNGTPKQRNSVGEVTREDGEKREVVSFEGDSVNRSAGAINNNRVASNANALPENDVARESTIAENNNPTLCSQVNLSPPSRKVLLNEIAWAGDDRSSSNEWIELYNPGEAIPLAGWQLLDEDGRGGIQIVFNTQDKIPAKGYFLILRSSNETNFIPEIRADKFYTGAINNSDETLRLFNNNCVLVDEAIAVPDWPAGEAGSHKTMERKADLSGWQTFAGATGVIMGTPRAENSKASSAMMTTNSENRDLNKSLKIIISEIQITGGPGKTHNDFIEIYNPNNQPVNLKGHRLVKRTKSGTSDSSIKSWTSDAFVPANGYYLWVNSNYSDLVSIANVSTSATIAADNGVAIRFGPVNTGIIIDSVSWGEAQNIFVEGAVFPINPVVNQSIQRKLQNNTFVDTNNNVEDFGLQNCPSPKSFFGNCATII